MDLFILYMMFIFCIATVFVIWGLFCIIVDFFKMRKKEKIEQQKKFQKRDLFSENLRQVESWRNV